MHERWLMKLREAIERVLILCPSPLTIQWQDEMLRWSGESFDIVFSAVDQQQLTNPWRRSNQVIASIDYAKQDDVRKRVWQQRWDLIIIDEAHKCSAYMNEFLPQASGRKKASVALARTVLQRRLASPTMAIFESIRHRLDKQQTLLEELENLSAPQRARRLAQLQGRISDAEQDEDDRDESERDQLAGEFTDAIELDQLRAGIAALQELLARARRVRDQGADSKLTALHECLKRAQEEFRTTKQICVATGAAGEGINLEFCRLMLNYDLPWNPTRLEQRLGRIHRIGPERDGHAFNFGAARFFDISAAAVEEAALKGMA